MTIFLVIVGFSFWADPDKRVDITLNMTLVVAALYLGNNTLSLPFVNIFTTSSFTVIGQIIPFVGYYTIMDTFVTVTFVLLSGTVAVHFLTQILDDEQSAKKYPLNKLFRMLMVMLFRLVWIPMSIILFVVLFDVTIPVIVAVLYISVVASVLYSALTLRTQLPRTFKTAILG